MTAGARPSAPLPTARPRCRESARGSASEGPRAGMAAISTRPAAAAGYGAAGAGARHRSADCRRHHRRHAAVAVSQDDAPPIRARVSAVLTVDLRNYSYAGPVACPGLQPLAFRLNTPPTTMSTSWFQRRSGSPPTPRPAAPVRAHGGSAGRRRACAATHTYGQTPTRPVHDHAGHDRTNSTGLVFQPTRAAGRRERGGLLPRRRPDLALRSTKR